MDLEAIATLGGILGVALTTAAGAYFRDRHQKKRKRKELDSDAPPELPESNNFDAPSPPPAPGEWRAIAERIERATRDLETVAHATDVEALRSELRGYRDRVEEIAKQKDATHEAVEGLRVELREYRIQIADFALRDEVTRRAVADLRIAVDHLTARIDKAEAQGPQG